MTEIIDFAGELRQMARNAEALAERHDIAEIAGLRRQVEEQAAKAQRDSDLIGELRRQVESMSRSFDALRRLRKGALGAGPPAVEILADALLNINDGCESFTSGSCREAGSGKTRTPLFTADAWCNSCVAHDALERAGALPAAADR